MAQNSIKHIACTLMAVTFCIGTPLAAQVRVACIGNSVTYGYGLENREEMAYPSVLHKLLGKDFEVGNFGHNGATLLRKGHNPYYLTAAFREALAFAPDIAIIHLGLNDTDPRNWPVHQVDFEPDYAWLIDTLRDVNPDMEIHIALLSPIFSGHQRFKSGTRDWHKEIREKIGAIAVVNGVGLMDFHTPLHRRPDLFPDNLHPDAQGAEILARKVYAHITGDFGGLKLGEIFKNGAVLQRGRPLPIFGKGNAEETVLIEGLGHKMTTEVDEQGNWRTDFPEMEAGGPYQLTVIHGEEMVQLDSIWIGDVWMLMGQSNMEWALSQTDGGESAVNNMEGQNPIRTYQIAPKANPHDEVWDDAILQLANNLDFFDGIWIGQERVQEYSGVGYYFARKIMEKEDVPIGLVQVTLGGAPLESFLSRESLEQDDLLVDMLSDWKTSDFIMPWVRERALKNIGDNKSKEQRHPYQPAYINESVISKLVPFAVKGVLWYQGESNVHNTSTYKKMFKIFVRDMRKNWGSDLPFYFVQLPGMSRAEWPFFREIQAELAEEIPGAEMAVALDLGDSLDVHPRNKKEVGERLALLALAETYGYPGIRGYSPVVQNVEARNGFLEVEFKSEGYLQINGDDAVKGFELVDAKGRREKTEGMISGKMVRLTLPSEFRPVWVWYGFGPFPDANLRDDTGLPVGPFRYRIIEDFN